MNDQKERQSTSLRAESRVNWGRKMVDGIPTDEQLSTGALMRIADAIEKGDSLGEFEGVYDIRRLIRVAQRLMDMRRRQPRRDQFHFTFEHPYEVPRHRIYFAITIFGFTISIHKQ